MDEINQNQKSAITILLSFINHQSAISNQQSLYYFLSSISNQQSAIGN
jgi:hypothetical protein